MTCRYTVQNVVTYRSYECDGVHICDNFYVRYGTCNLSAGFTTGEQGSKLVSQFLARNSIWLGCSGRELTLDTLPEAPTLETKPSGGPPGVFMPLDTPRPQVIEALTPVPLSSQPNYLPAPKHQSEPEQPDTQAIAAAAASWQRTVKKSKGSGIKAGEGGHMGHMVHPDQQLQVGSISSTQQQGWKKTKLDPALVNKADTAAAKAAETEAKLKARQSKYALTEGGSFGHR